MEIQYRLDGFAVCIKNERLQPDTAFEAELTNRDAWVVTENSRWARSLGDAKVYPTAEAAQATIDRLLALELHADKIYGDLPHDEVSVAACLETYPEHEKVTFMVLPLLFPLPVFSVEKEYHAVSLSAGDDDWMME